MALSKKTRTRAKQIKKNKRKHDNMSEQDKEPVFEKLRRALKARYLKRGLTF